MKRKFELEISNLIIHFGSKEFLEAFEARIWPIFEFELPSRRGETYLYQFYQVNLKKIGDDYYLIGRLMQRMHLKARQRLSKTNNLVSTDDEMQSDPTSIFMIRLFDHKLFVIPEQPRSPRSTTFRYVISKLLNEHYINIYQQKKKDFLKEHSVKRLSKDLRLKFEKNFDKEYPKPNVSLNPIGSKYEINNILDAFELVKSLRLEYFKTNNEDYELDEELITKFGESVNRTNSKTAAQEYRNNTDGLDVESVENLVTASTQTGGNCNFKMTGISSTGETIIRTQEHTKVKPKIEGDSDWPIERFATVAAERLSDLIENGQIKLANIVDVETSKRIARNIYNVVRKK